MEDPYIFLRSEDGQMYFPHVWDVIVYQQDVLDSMATWQRQDNSADRFCLFIGEIEELNVGC